MTKGNSVIKLKLETDVETENILDGQSRICNWLYNHLLEIGNDLKKQFIENGDENACKTLYTQRGLRNLIPQIKKEKFFLKTVHSSPLKNVALRLSQVIKNYQDSKKGSRQGKQTGWPKFSSWKKNWFSLLYDEPNKGFKIKDQKLILSLGVDKDNKRRYLELSIKEAHLLKNKTVCNLRIIKEMGRFYAVFTVQRTFPEPIKNGSKIIVLDPNHKNFAYGVDSEGKGIEIQKLNWLKIYDKRVDELKSKRDRCYKNSRQKQVLDEKGKPTGKTYTIPSKRWKKYNRALERALTKRRDQTKTFLFTIANKLCKDYDGIAVGDYTPQGEGITTPMRRAMNNRSLIGRFKEVLSWTATKSGKIFFEFDEKGTTRTCSHCNYICSEGLNPSIRKWECPHCHISHIRDENAAKNGFKKVIKDFKTKNFLVSCSDLVQVIERWAWCVLPSGVSKTLYGGVTANELQHQEIKT